jgi:hypothetical protein
MWSPSGAPSIDARMSAARETASDVDLSGDATRGEDSHMTIADDAAQEDFEDLGDLLRYLRKTYASRTGRSRAGMPKVTLTALSLIACMGEHGYPITSGAYSLLEQGKTLPRNPGRFFGAICTCLDVPSTDKYWVLLRYQYAYDLVARSVDRQFADRYVSRGSQALRIHAMNQSLE